jgi:Ca2+-binding EF-hand superfamily protein
MSNVSEEKGFFTKENLIKGAVILGGTSAFFGISYFIFKYFKKTNSKDVVNETIKNLREQYEREHNIPIIEINPKKLPNVEKLLKNKEKLHLLLSNNATAMKVLFKKFDINGDGTIDRNELHSLLDHLSETFGIEKPTEKMVLRFLEKIDTDHSGSISFEEFQFWFKDLKKNDFLNIDKPHNLEFSLSNAKKMFEEHDLDKNGYLDLTEFSLFVEDLSFTFHLDAPLQKNVNELFEKCSKNSKVYFSEFEENYFTKDLE